VVGGLTALLGPEEHELELAPDAILADELVERLRPQRRVDAVLAGERGRTDDLVAVAHAAPVPRVRSARRSRPGTSSCTPTSDARTGWTSAVP
jgi:hypothetical protein